MMIGEIDIDADEVIPGLFQGSAPPPGNALQLAGFKLLVLCAEEYQPPKEAFSGVKVIHAPNNDDGKNPFTPAQAGIAMAASRICAERMMKKDVGKAGVLVTCMAGRNRSGLVTALTLMRLGATPGAAIRAVKHARSGALSNDDFVEFLYRLGAV